MPKLALFIRPTCPYCLKVRRYMDGAGIELPLLDITIDRAALEELVEKGGMNQVPCLRIDEAYLYESDDIIAWLRENVQA